MGGGGDGTRQLLLVNLHLLCALVDQLKYSEYVFGPISQHEFWKNNKALTSD